MESLQEQIEYGRWCEHGQPLGTPGGADLMCGYCESGLTEWVEDRHMTLVVDIEGRRFWPKNGFWLSSLDRPSIATLVQLAKLKKALVFWSGLARDAEGLLAVSLYMVEDRSGYWQEPSR